MIYHIVVGDAAAGPLNEAIMLEPSLAGEVIVLKDILNVGPLLKEEGTTFSALRSDFWQQVTINEKAPINVDDLERLLEVSNAMYKSEDVQAWLWMAPLPADVCAYYWLLKYLSKHKNRFCLLNIAGLPFLDANGKVFYPKSISEIMPKELVKARRLARPVTMAEVETDGEEWRKMVQDNAGIRTLEGGKKITSRDEHYYDAQLISFCSQQFQKAQRIATQAITKYNIPTGDSYLGWRLRRMAEDGRLLLQGDITKTLREYEVKLPDETVVDTAGIP